VETPILPLINHDQIEGCLLGTALADASGAIFEGVPRAHLQEQFASPQVALQTAWTRQIHYTDDTQMTLALAKYLAGAAAIDSASLMQAFVDEYESWRGYGRGTRTLIDAYRYQSDWNFLADTLFPGGSLGNGAAMRSAPLGLRFVGDHATIWQQASLSAYPTHRHQLGIEGAQLMALATSLAVELPEISPQILSSALQPWCQTTVFGKRIKLLAAISDAKQIEQFGNGIEAHESVVTALACFSLSPDSYPDAIAMAIWQGGDTDTIAAMTGALCGARSGSSAIPAAPLENLEDEAFLKSVNTIAGDLRARIARQAT
jgi:poly(ADP-ribose) glycohydrolase ARH3